MTKTMANRNIAHHADVYPETEAQGYGEMSYTPRGYWTGHLPHRLREIYNDLIRRQRFVPTIYSYRTPIAWKDGDTWIIPAVSYSMTTAKHQSYLWQLRGSVSIPIDCGLEEYTRYRDGFSIYSRYEGRYGTVRAA